MVLDPAHPSPLPRAGAWTGVRLQPLLRLSQTEGTGKKHWCSLAADPSDPRRHCRIFDHLANLTTYIHNTRATFTCIYAHMYVHLYIYRYTCSGHSRREWGPQHHKITTWLCRHIYIYVVSRLSHYQFHIRNSIRFVARGMSENNSDPRSCLDLKRSQCRF